MGLRSALYAAALRNALALKSYLDTDYVGNPESEDYDDIVRKHINQENMVKLTIVPTWSNATNVTIMGYPKEEDREISGQLNYSSSWEPHHTNALCGPWRDKGSKGNFLDVGANIGTYALPVAACTRQFGATVIAVEGMPTIADHLRAGIVENQAENLALYAYAVGAQTRKMAVTMMLDPVNKGGSSVAGNKRGDKSMLAKGIEEVSVPLTTLDAMLKHDNRLTAVLSAKVDIEGNEGRFLQGAKTFFSKHPPCYLMIELIHEWLEAAGTPLPKILAQLKEWGYNYVPDYKYLTECKWFYRTIHIQQTDMAKCVARVEAAYNHTYHM